jgi:ferredoxin
MAHRDNIEDPFAACTAAARAWSAVPGSRSESIAYHCDGELLIIGTYVEVTAVSARLDSSLKCTALVIDVAEHGSDPEQITRSGDTALTVVANFPNADGLQIIGHMGSLDVRVVRDDGSFNLSERHDRCFDLILDLGVCPLLAREIPPPGYCATSGDEGLLEQMLVTLPNLIGEFDKPKFINYDPTICAHGERGLTGCTRCLEVCPALAITSIGERIKVDANLCQGAGSCTAVCPTGAITYTAPTNDIMLERVSNALAAYANAGGINATLLFCSEDTDLPLAQDDFRQERADRDDEDSNSNTPGTSLLDSLSTVIGARIEEVGVLGLDSLLSALALGAHRIVVYAPIDDTPPSLVRAVTREIERADTITTSLGHGAERFCIVEDPDQLENVLRSTSSDPSLERAQHSVSPDKRDRLQFAANHLWKLATVRPAVVALDSLAAYGDVRVDGSACTLCMACVVVCPANALSDGGTRPALLFNEKNCVQCGLCESACPEAAITRQQRWVFDPQLRTTSRVLNEDEPFPCTRCGTPFASRSAVAKMTEKLKDHPMFAGKALGHLQLCEECRTREMFSGSA